VEVIGVRGEDCGDPENGKRGQAASLGPLALVFGGGAVGDGGVPLAPLSGRSAQRNPWD